MGDEQQNDFMSKQMALQALRNNTTEKEKKYGQNNNLRLIAAFARFNCVNEIRSCGRWPALVDDRTGIGECRH